MNTSGSGKHQPLDRPHLFFLSEFLKPTSPDRYAQGYYEFVFKESALKVFQGFKDAGLVELASLEDRLAFLYKASDIKNLLAERGLKVSGRKAELIARFVEADQSEAEKLASSVQVYVCTLEGQLIANKYIETERCRKETAQLASFECLRNGDYHRAAQIVSEYIMSSLFPSFGPDWFLQDGHHEIPLLESIADVANECLVEDADVPKVVLAAKIKVLWNVQSYNELPQSIAKELDDVSQTDVNCVISHARWKTYPTIEKIELQARPYLESKQNSSHEKRGIFARLFRFSTHQQQNPLDRPHLLFLSKFLGPASPNMYANDAYQSVLGESVHKAFRDFQKRGLVELAPLEGRLNHLYDVPDLKKLLRQRGLKVSGKKAELINRFVEADRTEAERLTSTVEVYVCTSEGKVLADEYIEKELQRKQTAQLTCLQHLRKSEYKQASRAVTAYEVDSIFPRGLGIDWSHRDSKSEVELLELVTDSPSIYFAEDAEASRMILAASMEILWGVNSYRRLCRSIVSEFDDLPEVAVRRLTFYAFNQQKLREYAKQPSIYSGVRISSSYDCCWHCRSLKGEYSFENVPLIPSVECTDPRGCRCIYSPVFRNI